MTIDRIIMEVFNLSVSASYLIVAVFLVRLLLPRMPKKYICGLWGLAALRLLVPFHLESQFSAVPTGDIFTENAFYREVPAAESGSRSPNTAVNDGILPSFENTESSGFGFEELFLICFIVWLAGMAVMAFTGLRAYSRLQKQVREAVLIEKGIYYCPSVPSPFILGIIKPKIYLPFAEVSAENPVLAHERAHIARRDHLKKAMSFLVLTVHWFNPLVWAGYKAFCRDVESACDDAVIADLSLEQRKIYSHTLLQFASGFGHSAFCPLAFGEIGVRKRVRSVLHFKKPSKWIVGISIALLIAAAVFFLTSPAGYSKSYDEALDKAVGEAILSLEKENFTEEFLAEGHEIWGVEKDEDRTKVYANTTHSAYSFFDDQFLEFSGTGAIPAVLYFEDGEKYTFDRIEYPLDGELFEKSVREMFPKSLQRKALSGAGYSAIKQEKIRQAEAYLKSIGRDAEVIEFAGLEEPRLWSEGFSNVAEEIAANHPRYPQYIGTKEALISGERICFNSWSDGKSEITFTAFYKDYDALFEKIIITVKPDGTYEEMIACGRPVEK